MELFSINKNKLIPIERDPFKLEKDIQSLVEANLESLFNLEFVSTEFTIDEFRLDTLAFDPDNNSFVIIEYKRGEKSSIIDQGYSYLSTMLNNKAEFVLAYNEKTGNQIKKSDIVWEASRIIFVSRSFTHYQRNSINFKDIPFELWEIRKFENNLVTLEQYSSQSNASVKELSKKDSQSEIAKVSSEVKLISEEEHVQKLDASSKAIWGMLKEKLESYPDTSFKSIKHYIAWWKDNRVVCYIRFQKKQLRIGIRRGIRLKNGKPQKRFFNLDDPKKLAEEYQRYKYKNGETDHTYRIQLSKPEDIDYAMFLLNQKYEALN